MEKISQMNKL